MAREFRAATLNTLWVGNIAYIPTGEGWLYLAVLLDVCSRRVVGWAMAEHLRAGLALDALQFAVQQRHPVGGMREVVRSSAWPTRQAARHAIFEWITVFYHRQRLHKCPGLPESCLL